jgi:hypothetical protein
MKNMKKKMKTFLELWFQIHPFCSGFRKWQDFATFEDAFVEEVWPSSSTFHAFFIVIVFNLCDNSHKLNVSEVSKH